MARNASDINPNDTYPRRNLPEKSEPWGRTLEDRQVAVEKAILALQNTVAGSGRAFDAATGTLSEQVLRAVSSVSGAAYASVFPVTTSALSVVSCHFVVPAGFTTVDIVTQGYFHVYNSTDPRGYVYGAVSVDGTPGNDFLGYEIGASASNAISLATLGDTRTIAVTSGHTVNVEVTLRKSGTDSFSAHASNRAHLNVLAIYHN